MNAIQRAKMGLPKYDTYKVRAYPSRAADRSKPVYESSTQNKQTALHNAVELMKELQGDFVVILSSLEQGSIKGWAWINGGPAEINTWQ